MHIISCTPTQKRELTAALLLFATGICIREMPCLQTGFIHFTFLSVCGINGMAAVLSIALQVMLNMTIRYITRKGKGND